VLKFKLAPAMNKTITYNLATVGGPVDFYDNLSRFTDAVLQEARVRLGRITDEYIGYLSAHRTEPLRSRDEYLLELIITGVLLQNYYGKAARVPSLFTSLLSGLYRLRKQHTRLKPTLDRLRGVLAYGLLEQKAVGTTHYSLQGWRRLLRWLEATGEFSEEALRLGRWTGFFRLKPGADLRLLFQQVASFASFLDQEGKEQLGAYVWRVPHFLQHEARRHRYREDYFFVSRGRNEYFLNMLGAEILNRHLRAAFQAMPRKAVLLPTCMRTPPAGGCKARHDGKELVCRQCSRQCRVGQVATAMRKRKVTTYLIPHSSGFSRFLRHWENTPDTGLVGVTCMLNLLAGGYEMKRRNIPAQCIFLDYCGCQKHWGGDGYPTSLHLEALVRIVTGG
jgi:hypothetical protein